MLQKSLNNTHSQSHTNKLKSKLQTILPSKGLKKKQQINNIIIKHFKPKKINLHFSYRLNKKALQDHYTLIPEIHNLPSPPPHQNPNEKHAILHMIYLENRKQKCYPQFRKLLLHHTRCLLLAKGLHHFFF
jgi:hypothetical protein